MDRVNIRSIFSLPFIFLCLWQNIYGQNFNNSIFSVPIRNNLFTTSEEVSNISYLEFLHYVMNDSSSSLHEEMIPIFNPQDSGFSEKSYLRYPMRRQYPVVSISYTQAVSFCSWLGEVLQRSTIQKEKRLDTVHLTYEVRLPSIEEWTLMALKYDYDLEASNDVDKLKNRSFIRKKDFQKIAKDYGYKQKSFRKKWREFNDFFTQNKIFAFENVKYQGQNELYGELLNRNFPWSRLSNEKKPNIPLDLRGNVSEMTLTEGVAKGGNWNTKAYEIGVYDYVKYDEPSNTVGFRCVCEIKEK